MQTVEREYNENVTTSSVFRLERSFQFTRIRRLIIAAALFALAAYASAELVLGGDPHALAHAALVAVGIGALVAILNNWRRGLYIFLGWILFEDFVRKYLGNNMVIYFAKDAVALALYFAFFWTSRSSFSKRLRPPFRVPLLLFLWFGIIQVLNPASSSVFYGLLGMKLYFWYCPLLFVGYALINDETRLRRMFTYLMVLSLIVVGLAIAQSIIGPSFLNPATVQEDIRSLSNAYRVSPITGLTAYRPTSVFVSTGRLQNFLVVCWPLALGFAGYLLLRSSSRARFFAFTTLAIIACGSIMSASRGVFMWSLASAFVLVSGFIWGAPWRTREGHRLLRVIQRSLLFAGISFTILAASFPEHVGSRLAIYSETLSPTSPQSELVFRSRDYPWQNFLAAFDYPMWPYGYGIGTASLGVQYVTRLLQAPPMGIGVESGYGQLILELGVLGLILWILLAVSICLSCWKVVKSLKGTRWFPLGFSIFWYAFLLLIPLSYYGFVAYQDFVMNSFLWVLLGVLFRMKEMNTLALAPPG